MGKNEQSYANHFKEVASGQTSLSGTGATWGVTNGKHQVEESDKALELMQSSAGLTKPGLPHVCWFRHMPSFCVLMESS